MGTKALYGTAVVLSLYLASGIFQPIIVDVVRYLGGDGSTSPPTCLPMLFSCIGMTVAGLLQFRTWNATDWTLLSKPGFWILTLVDFLSGTFIYAGLEIVGSGTFILIYASCLPWTAILSRCLLRSPIPNYKWVAVVIITAGLATTALQSFLQQEAEQAGLLAPPPVPTVAAVKHHQLIAFGSALVFLGSFFHALMFVLGEKVLSADPATNAASGGNGKDGLNKPSPLFMCTVLGVIEAAVLIVYNIALSCVYGVDALYVDNFNSHGHHLLSIAASIVGLIVVNGIHAAAFFFLLQKSGAVSMGVLKGVMTLSVFVFAAIFLCRFQPEQCINPFKLASCVLIVTGSFVYYGIQISCVHGRLRVSMSSKSSEAPSSAAPTRKVPVVGSESGEESPGTAESQALLDNC